VLGNVGSIIAFRTGLNDARALEDEFQPTFSRHDLVVIPNFQTCVSLLVNGERLPPFTMRTIKDDRPEDPARARRIVERCRQEFGRPLREVEKEVRSQMPR